MSKTKKRIALGCILLCMLFIFTGCKSRYKFTFDYEIDTTECSRGSRVAIDTTITNDSGFTYTYNGAYDDFSADVYLYIDVHGERYLMQVESLISPAKGKWQIENGESRIRHYWFTVPSNAPIGQYNLILSYKDYRVEYEGVLTVVE